CSPPRGYQPPMRTRRRRMPSVVDTNVPIVANRRCGEPLSCANACAQALIKIRASGLLLIDRAGGILAEYRRHCSLSGQPGVGDAFVRWVHDNRARQDLVGDIVITPKPGVTDDFVEFPAHPDLAGFDPSDRKFVAVANAHQGKPRILQATDSKWWGCRVALKECGIIVEFLCPGEIQQAYQRKFGR
ncbi:MAG: hypothetical protein ACRELG_00335, partial [Gemmataceae bacterium]